MRLEPNITRLAVVEHSKSVSMKCFVTRGSPKPILAWYKGEDRIKLCGKISNCTLEIVNLLHPREDGIYTCNATSTEGMHYTSIVLAVLGNAQGNLFVIPVLAAITSYQ